MSERAYKIGDTVVGKFSCSPWLGRRPAVVRYVWEETTGRLGFGGRDPNPPAGYGWGVWGWDDEIAEVLAAHGPDARGE